jgi:hypothetical protein
MIDENAIRTRYAAIKDQLDERGRRLFVAAEKAAAGIVTLTGAGRPDTPSGNVVPLTQPDERMSPAARC